MKRWYIIKIREHMFLKNSMDDILLKWHFGGYGFILVISMAKGGDEQLKVLALPIEVVSYTESKGYIKPIRFRMQINDEHMKVIKVDRIICKDTEKLAGNVMIVYKCQSLIDNVLRQFEIKYELNSCKWMLYKI